MMKLIKKTTNLVKDFFPPKVASEPIFIVGCGHSGTSILLAILDAHPNIHAIPYESYFAIDTNPRKLRRKHREFNQRTIDAKKKRWIEKTPKHILHIGKILQWKPKSKILIILRDGRDVAYSIKKRTGSLDQGIDTWLSDNLAGKEFWDHPQVHVLKYEDVVKNFEPTMKKALDFLGEEYSDDLKDYWKKPRKYYSQDLEKPSDGFGENHTQHRNWQINQPLFDGSAKWKELTESELAQVELRAGELLKELEYTDH